MTWNVKEIKSPLDLKTRSTAFFNISTNISEDRQSETTEEDQPLVEENQPTESNEQPK